MACENEGECGPNDGWLAGKENEVGQEGVSQDREGEEEAVASEGAEAFRDAGIEEDLEWKANLDGVSGTRVGKEGWECVRYR